MTNPPVHRRDAIAESVSNGTQYVRRVLIVTAVALIALAVLFAAGLRSLTRALTQADPYPAFMMDFRQTGTRAYDTGARAYDDVERMFSEFIINAFRPGSAAKDAIATITRGGFKIAASGPDAVKLVWERRAGPCSEVYSIVVNPAADGTIAMVSGRMQPICL